jgi:GT2 family glycosyltransferase
MELIIGDTGSDDEKTLELYGHSRINEKVVYLHTYHFSRNNNSLVSYANFKNFLFLNNDVLIQKNSESIIKAWKLYKELGTEAIISAELSYPDSTIQHAGVDFINAGDSMGLSYHPGHRLPTSGKIKDRNYYESPAVTGAFLLISAKYFYKSGGFDEGFSKECQDISLCLEARRLGIKCFVGNFGKLTHLENATRPKNEEDWDDRRRFLRKYKRYIEILK